MDTTEYDIIPAALLNESGVEDIERSVEALCAAIVKLDDELLDVFCDGGELQREQSAYTDEDYSYELRRLDARTHVLHAEMAVKAWTLATTLQHLKQR